VTILNAAGFKLNISKCLLEPAQRVAHLGHVIDLKSGTISPEPEKLQADRTRVKKYLRQRHTSATESAALVGRLEDCHKSNAAMFGFNATIMKDAAKTARHHGWRKRILLSEKLRYCLGLALAALAKPVPLPFWRAKAKRSWRLHTDASSHSWGAVLRTPEGRNSVMSDDFTEVEAAKHITTKETLAPALALSRALHLFERGDQVRLYVDAVTACRTDPASSG